MYKGSNPTALQSQQWIVESLIVLMKEKDYHKITIMDICKRADLSRQTFYNVFQTKEEILRFCLQGKYVLQFERLAQKESITIQDIVEAFALVIDEDKEVLQLMIANQLDGIIADEMSKCISMFVTKFVKEAREDILPYSEALLSGALSSLLVFWFRQEKKIAIEHIIQLISDFLNGDLYDL